MKSRSGRPIADPYRKESRGFEQGFTLLEVLVALTVLALGAALVLSLISGSLGNIRKVQIRARTIEHAQTVMETALLDDSIQQPTTFAGDFEDGTRWSMRVEDYELPDAQKLQSRQLPQNLQAKLLSFTLEMFAPNSRASEYRVQTLKLVGLTPENQTARMPQ